MTRLKAFVNATVIPVESPRVDRGVMLLDGDRILAVGPSLEIPSDAEVVDLTGRFVMPGLIDAHCHVGMSGGPSGVADASENADPIDGRVRALESIDPGHEGFAIARKGGVTAVHILPLGNPIAGLSVTSKTAGSIIDDMVIREPSGLKAALGEGPKRIYGARAKSPMTRMGVAGLIRDYFYRVGRYVSDRESGGATHDPALESGALVLSGQIPLRIHAHRSDDVVTAVRLCEEFGLPFSIEHCTGGHLVSEFLGRRQVTAHVGPVLASRGAQERAEADERNAAVLADAGVKVCFGSDHPFTSTGFLMVSGALAMKHGMAPDQALEALTINAAQSLGVADRIGSLAPGKDADFVVLSGPPLLSKSVVLSTYINGRAVWERSV